MHACLPSSLTTRIAKQRMHPRPRALMHIVSLLRETTAPVILPPATHQAVDVAGFTSSKAVCRADKPHQAAACTRRTDKRVETGWGEGSTVVGERGEHIEPLSGDLDGGAIHVDCVTVVVIGERHEVDDIGKLEAAGKGARRCVSESGRITIKHKNNHHSAFAAAGRQQDHFGLRKKFRFSFLLWREFE